MSSLDTIPIFLTFDESYTQHASVAMTSVWSKTTAPIRFYVLSSDLTEVSREKITSLRKIRDFDIEFTTIDSTLFRRITPKIARIPIEACYRLMIPEIFPHISKAIYLDSDLIVQSDIQYLWDEDISEVYACVVEDLMPKRKIGFEVERYFNSGVLLLNLERIRKDFSLTRFLEIEEAYRGKIQYQDQDILNIGFGKKVRYLDRRWNVTTLFFMELEGRHLQFQEEIVAATQDPWICHFIGPWKPWIFPASPFPAKYVREYFRYLALTPFFGKQNAIFRDYFLLAPFRLIKEVLRFFKRQSFCLFQKSGRVKLLILFRDSLKEYRGTWNLFRELRKMKSKKFLATKEDKENSKEKDI
jgi:lipopolysaccharide biosynthesis glycosyltransferase